MSDVNFSELVNFSFQNVVGGMKDLSAETAVNGNELGVIIAIVIFLLLLFFGAVVVLIVFKRAFKNALGG